ncbi:DUF3530 family protein [Shewanella sp. Isolate11]|uniref:DUF3530 family protein n=1 Tax=Shewanella sp. Isolate11 TaxID=2908530 RepID=UPI001EFE1C16|nr:DUF3530 family protein [Shewanella sp. Isolate11]MCG9695539.1 alpha/beta hydrolase family protein [Shewanella sp. Isolate11]
MKPLLLITLLISLVASSGFTLAKYDYVPTDEIAEIQINGSPSQVLVRPWQGQHQMGAAILIGDLGTHADPVGIISYLRRHLNQQGWATISLPAPDAAAQVNFETKAGEIPKAGEKQLEPQTDTAQSMYTQSQWREIRDSQNQQLIQTINQIDPLGQPYAGKRMLIVEARGAGIVIDQLFHGRLATPDILVVINPYSPHSEENRQLPQQLGKLNLAVLDIQSPDATAEALATAEQRLQLAPQNKPLRYEQQRLALNLDQPSTWLEVLKMIDGFARRIDKAYP